ncbi:MAG: RES domain-containing protein, partial [Betaproteobacteria bacterium]|nr:RES domain-containing protein [Betaproteobacteria bacterium]
GVWYGSDSVETTVYESVYHWYKSLLCDAGFDRQVVIAERKVYQVACAAALLDFRAASTEYSDLLNPVDYSLCQSVGARIHREGHPGLLRPPALLRQRHQMLQPLLRRILRRHRRRTTPLHLLP